MQELSLFFSYVMRHKGSYLAGVFCLFLTNWLAVTIPTYIGQSIDLLGSDNYDLLVTNVYWVMLFAVFVMISRTASRMLFFNPGRLVERDFKDDAFKKLTQSQQPFYRQNPVGGLISIVNNDINGIRAMAGVGMMNLFNIFFSLSLTPYKMWQISPSLMLYCLLPMIGAFLIVNYAIKAMRRLMSERMRHLQDLSSQAVTFLNGVDVIKGHQLQPWALGKFAHSNEKILKVSIEQLKIRAFVMPVLEYTELSLKILILGVGGWQLIHADMSLGDLTAFLTYASLLAMPFMSLGRLIATIQMGMVSLKSMGRILQQTTDDHSLVAESVTSESLFSKGLRVQQLSFQYASAELSHDDDKRPFALNNISFDIAPGEKVALLGRVGSGKTTLVNCLTRFYDLPKGCVFLNDQDVTDLSRKQLRSVIRTLTQEPFLFSDTVENNIQFGARDADKTLSMEQTLYQSAMQKEVNNFPQGKETLVGEKGILLSGGQKQRISLARGMYTPSQLVILDNVLSAVDNETERFLLEQIFHNMQTQSCLIVSHRQAVLEKVDKILLLEEGTIVAQGSHHELLKSSTLYRDTWQFLQTTHAAQEETQDGE